LPPTPRELHSNLCFDEAPAVAVLNIGGQNAHAEQKAERVDEDVTLTPGDFLACVIALRVERGAPF
jgi:hypothetical protein